MYRYLLLSLLLLLPPITTHSQSNQETPSQGLAAILMAYQANDARVLIHERYAEIHKASSESDFQKLNDFFTRIFTNPKKMEMITSTFEAALGVEPAITTYGNADGVKTGKVARFETEGGTVKLYEMSDGRWGFSL